MNDTENTKPIELSDADKCLLVAQFLTATEAAYGYDTAIRLVHEEVKEAAEALAAFLKEFSDMQYVLAGLYITAVSEGRGEVSIDQTTLDNIETLTTYADAVFTQPIQDESFARVHKSNMSKLVNGKALRREDGKILKGPNYKAPELTDLI